LSGSRASRVAAATIAAAAAATVVVADLGPAASLPAAHHDRARVSIVGATRVCADVSGDSHRTSRLTAASVPAAVASTGGSVTAVPLGHQAAKRHGGRAGTSARAFLSEPRSLASRDVTSHGGPVRVGASGEMASGLEVEQTDRYASGSVRGLANLRCAAPGSPWWFVGPSGGVHADDTLTVSNPADAPAVVHVGIYGPDGPVSDPDAENIPIAPGKQVALPLGKLAPGVAVTALHVSTRTGRVVASVRSRRRHHPHPAMVGVVPAAAAPAHRQVLPGIVPGPGARRLVLANPGANDADVTVRVVTPQGSFVPNGLAHVAVAAGSVATVKLAPVLHKKAAAVRLTSSTPVTASLLATEKSDDTGVGDLAWTAASDPLSGPTLITDNRLGHHAQSHLVLSAPKGAARVVVAGLGGNRRTVSISAGRTAFVSLAPVVHGTSGAVVVRPTPGSGPVYAARDLYEAGSSGPLLAVLPLRTAPRTVSAPPARYDPDAAAR
jgi:hypothetical protein